MKSIKEKQLLVKWSKAMNEPIDPDLLEEVERYNSLQNDVLDSVRKNSISDLVEAQHVAEELISKISLEYPKPPSLDDLFSLIQEEADELVQTQPKQISVTEEPITPATKPATKTLAEKAAIHITKEIKLEEKTDSFQQPNPLLVEKNFEAVQKKLKFLEQAIGRIAATGPGSGEVNLRNLDDINSNSIPNDNSDKFLKYSQANNNFEFAAVVAQAQNGLPAGGNLNDIIVKIDSTNYNANWKKPDTLFAYVRNAENFTINKGNAVYIYEASGDKASVKQAINSSDVSSAKTLGLSAENIPHGSLGNIITQGPLVGINTSNFNEGDSLYLGNISGTLTKFKPFAPQHIVFVGIVERANQGQGIVYVRTQNGFELEELHNVNIDHTYNLSNGHTLIYNTSNNLWENNYLTSNHITEDSKLFFTNTRAISALTSGQNISISANGRITATSTGGGGAVDNVNGLVGTVLLNTSNIPESSNLYFTNARVVSALSAGQGIVLESNGQIVSTATGTVTGVNGQTGNVSLTTSNVAEGTNLYYSNDKVSANVATLGYASNSYVNIRLLTKANVADLTTANIAEVTNLYYTNARVYSNVIELSYITASSLSGYATNNQLSVYATNAQISLKANINDLTTANVSEVTNLYFTNSRSIAALTAGENIVVDSNGRVTAIVADVIPSIPFNNTNLDFYSVKSILSINKNSFRFGEYDYFVDDGTNYSKRENEVLHNGTSVAFSNAALNLGSVDMDFYYYINGNNLIFEVLNPNSYTNDYFDLSQTYQSNVSINVKGHVSLIEV